jgi:hypothetical protein
MNRLSRYFSPLRYVEGLAVRLGLNNAVFTVDPLDILIAIGSKKDSRS